MKTGKETRLGQSSEIVLSAFKQREKKFVAALEKVLIALSEDQISRQMLQDETSEKYIAKRVQEVFRQIIVDDRENFIERILTKLQTFESLYKSEQQEIIRYLGEDFLIKNSMPKVGPIQRISHVHLLIDVIRDLNATINQLQSENNEYSEMVKKSGRGGKRVEYNSNSPYFMHIFCEVDLTQLSNNLKIISAENEETKHAMRSLIKKTAKIISLIKQKSMSAVSLYNKKINKLQLKLKKEKSNFAKIKEIYNNDMEQMKEEIEQVREEVKTKDQENMQLKSSITSHSSDAKELKVKQNKLENDLQLAKKQNEELFNKNNEYEEKIFSLQLEQSKSVKQIEKLKTQNQTLMEELENQREEAKENENNLIKNQSSYKQAKKELDLEKQKTQELVIEMEGKDQTIEALKQKIVSMSQENKELQEKYSDKQDELQQLSVKNQAFQNKISELTTKCEEAQTEADDIKLNYESNLAQITQEMRALKKQLAKQEIENKEKSDLIEQQKEQIETITKENDTLHNQLLTYKNDIKENLAPAATRLQQDNIALTNELEESNKKAASLQDTINEMKKKLVEQQQQITDLEEDMEEKNSKIEECQSLIEKLKQ